MFRIGRGVDLSWLRTRSQFRGDCSSEHVYICVCVFESEVCTSKTPHVWSWHLSTGYVYIGAIFRCIVCRQTFTRGFYILSS